MREMNAEQLETLLNETAQKLYAQHRSFVPTYPWVFVRVLKREQKVGSIIVSEIEQNKPVHEGIVLATWAPFMRNVASGKLTDSELAQNLPRKFKNYAATGPALAGAVMGEVTRTVYMQSQFTPGEHVLFPHFAGAPIDGFSDKHYRVVSEDCDFSTKGGIFATVDYDDAGTTAQAAMKEMIETVFDQQTDVDGSDSRVIAMAIAARILDRFLLVDREQNSATLSGR